MGNQYNNFGYVSKVQRVDTNAVLWQANSQDARGNVLQFTLGNGVVTNQTFDPDFGRIQGIIATKGSIPIQNQAYTFDSLGNLTRRQDLLVSLDQRLCYDNMNRLKQANLGSCSSGSTDNTYDARGNLTSKLGVGAYVYGAGTAGPDAVTTANGNTYAYDLNGSMTTVTGNMNRTIAYTYTNLPKQIVENGVDVLDIVYGPNNNRIKRVDNPGASPTTTTYAANGLYEKVVKNGVTTHKHYIGNFAVYESSGATTKVSYLHKDHIGSLVATSKETVNSAADVSFISNDAWGKRLNDNWTGTATTAGYLPPVTPQGFTGHEHLDGVGLIHMNGRVYDPVLGRFLSADPVLQAPYNSQSYNRYSYVMNNPLSLVDPTGFEWVGYCGMNDSGGTTCHGYYDHSIEDIFADLGYHTANFFEDVGEASVNTAVGAYHLAGNIAQDMYDQGKGCITDPTVGGCVEAVATFSPVGPEVVVGTKVVIGAKAIILPFFVKVVGRYGDDGVRLSNRLGREGESAVRWLNDIGSKPREAILMNGRGRIPDGLTDTVLSEVKNVGRLSYTRQLRDYAEYAQDTGRSFDLYTRPNTKISAPLQEAIDSGLINHKFIR